MTDPAPEPTPTPDPAPADPPADPKSDEGKTFTQADLDRIIEGRFKKFGDYDEIKTELSKIKKANETESEKAVTAAKEEARRETLAETGPRLVAAEFRIALAGRRTMEEVAKLIEDYDLTKYLKDGEVDVKRVAEKADLLAPPTEEKKTAPTFGGGARKTADKPEVTPGMGRLRSAYADTAK